MHGASPELAVSHEHHRSSLDVAAAAAAAGDGGGVFFTLALLLLLCNGYSVSQVFEFFSSSINNRADTVPIPSTRRRWYSSRVKKLIHSRSFCRTTYLLLPTTTGRYLLYTVRVRAELPRREEEGQKFFTSLYSCSGTRCTVFVRKTDSTAASKDGTRGLKPFLLSFFYFFFFITIIVRLIVKMLRCCTRGRRVGAVAEYVAALVIVVLRTGVRTHPRVFTHIYIYIYTHKETRLVRPVAAVSGGLLLRPHPTSAPSPFIPPFL